MYLFKNFYFQFFFFLIGKDGCNILNIYNRRNEYNRTLIEWSKISPQIIDFCIALTSFDLPAYVLLEIIDWLPLFQYVDHKKKIDLIINLKKSISKIFENKKIKEN